MSLLDLEGLNGVWIGYTDEGTEGQWRWTGTGTSASYTNWTTGEPKNIIGNEDCAAIYAHGQWNALPCSTNAVFVCEKGSMTVIKKDQGGAEKERKEE